jgi:capsule polysaccharide export protein KpsE/RkpR
MSDSRIWIDSTPLSRSNTDAGRNWLFLEGRVCRDQKALKQAEERLNDHQFRSKAVLMEGQAKAALEAVATLEGQIVAADVQLKSMQTFATQQNPDVIRLKELIEEMRPQLKRMEYGPSTGNLRRLSLAAPQATSPWQWVRFPPLGWSRSG